MRVWWCEEHECSGYIRESVVLVDGRVIEAEEGERCWAWEVKVSDWSAGSMNSASNPHPKNCRMVEAVLTRRDTEPETLDRNKLGGW